MLTEEMVENAVGDVRLNDACENTQIINVLGISIIAMGLHDVVIVASPEGILISDREQSSYISLLLMKLISGLCLPKSHEVKTFTVNEGDVIRLPLNTKHTVKFLTEVQMGRNI